MGNSEWTQTTNNQTILIDDESEWELEAWPINGSPQSGFSMELPKDLFQSDDEFKLNEKDHEHIAYVSQMAAGLTYAGYELTPRQDPTLFTPSKTIASIPSFWTIDNTVQSTTNNPKSGTTIIHPKPRMNHQLTVTPLTPTTNLHPNASSDYLYVDNAENNLKSNRNFVLFSI